MTSAMPAQPYQSTAPAYHNLHQQVSNAPFYPNGVGHPYPREQLVPPTLGGTAPSNAFSQHQQSIDFRQFNFPQPLPTRSPTWQPPHHMPLMADRSVGGAIFQTQQPQQPVSLPKAPSSSEIMLAELKSIKDLQAKSQETLKNLETSQTESKVTLKKLETTMKRIEGDVGVLKTNMGSVFESFLRLELERSLGLEFIKPVHFKCILEMANSIAGTNPGHMTAVLDALWRQLPETLTKLCDFLGVSDRNAFDLVCKTANEVKRSVEAVLQQMKTSADNVPAIEGKLWRKRIAIANHLLKDLPRMVAANARYAAFDDPRSKYGSMAMMVLTAKASNFKLFQGELEFDMKGCVDLSQRSISMGEIKKTLHVDLSKEQLKLRIGCVENFLGLAGLGSSFRREGLVVFAYSRGPIPIDGMDNDSGIHFRFIQSQIMRFSDGTDSDSASS